MTETDSRPPNPFDYVHEIDRPELFAGRREELAEILALIKPIANGQSRAIPCAIVGERRVGKSSLLLRVMHECANLKFLATRVVISEEIVTDPSETWHYIFTAITSTIAQASPPRSASLDTRSLDTYDPSPSPAAPILEFETSYNYKDAARNRAVDVHMLTRDFQAIDKALLVLSVPGLVLMLDEAEHLQLSRALQSQLKVLCEASRKIALVFAGDPRLSSVFTDKAAPLYLQVNLRKLTNFAKPTDVAECALQPLTATQRTLLDINTLKYITQLSQGKPNQIRLICYAIYSRYENRLQDDLSISIEAIERTLQLLTDLYTEEDLKRFSLIRNLDPVDLEVLYQMTEFPDWSIEDVARLGETFRGEQISTAATERRIASLSEKKAHFSSLGLMRNDSSACKLQGDEYLALYLRFWHELRKYEKIRKTLQLGDQVPTAFTQAVQKMVTALQWELGGTLDAVKTEFDTTDRTHEEFARRLSQRLAMLQELLSGKMPDVKEQFPILADLVGTCQMLAGEKPYDLFYMSVKNLTNPREAMRVELYVENAKPSSGSPEAMARIQRQAEQARLLIEGYGAEKVTIPGIRVLLEKNTPGFKWEEFLAGLPVVDSWRVQAIEQLVSSRDSRELGNKQPTNDKDEAPWIKTYAQGDINGAIQAARQRLAQVETRLEQARIYNDLGYLEYAKHNLDQARVELDRAYQLHNTGLCLTLSNQAVVAIDAHKIDEARQKIRDALLVTYSRDQIDAGYLMLRLLPSPVFSRTRFEQSPANTIEAAYVNLAFS